MNMNGELPDGKTLPTHPCTVHTILKLLEASGKVNPIMPHHTFQAEGDTYNITCDETIALEVKSDARTRKYTIANVSGVCDLVGVQESEYVSIISAFE